MAKHFHNERYNITKFYCNYTLLVFFIIQCNTGGPSYLQRLLPTNSEGIQDRLFLG